MPVAPVFALISTLLETQAARGAIPDKEDRSMVARGYLRLMFHSCLFLMLHCAGSSLAQEYRGRVQ